MAVIRLELEVDSAVYPELHAALQAIGNPASRGERFRQLAATGLVWETVRIHGASVSQIPAAPRVPVAEPWPEAPRGNRTGGKGAGRTAEKRPPAPTRQGDFLDLALNAAPAAPALADPIDTRKRDGGLDMASLHIPMLLDVVNAPPSPRAKATGSISLVDPLPAAARLHDDLTLQTPAPPSANPMPDPGGAPIEHASARVPAPELVQKTVVRSRLLRMKEMGLFKNG